MGLGWEVVVGCVMCVVWCVWRRRTGRRVVLPPGPRGWPIVGQLGVLRQKYVHERVGKWAAEYGPLMSLRLGSRLAIVASSPDMARALLQTHDKVFASRPCTAAGVHLMFGRTDIGFAPYGPYWRLLRQLCLSDLFHPSRLLSFHPIRSLHVSSLLSSLRHLSLSHSPVPLRPHLLLTLTNIICHITLGSFSHSHHIVHLMSEAAHLMSQFNVGDYLPFLNTLDLQGCVRRMKAHRQRIGSALQRLIDHRRSENRKKALDFLDVLLSTPSLQDDNIKAVLMDMLTGGADTSVATIEWAMGELLANPKAMQKLTQELDTVVGEQNMVKESDIPHLPYLQATVKETMRLHPFLPLLMPHEALEACEVGGFHIPAGTRAYVNVWAIGRDPSIWGANALEFEPERFIKQEGEMVPRFGLLPFGAGRRGCPGAGLGLLHVHLLLATLLHTFTWSSPSPSPSTLAPRPHSLALLMHTPLSPIPSPRPLLLHS